MLDWKRYKLISISFVSSFFIFSFFLYGRIDFDTIVFLSLITAFLIESIYDIKNKTVGKYFYSDSDPYSHYIRYLTFIIMFAIWLWVVYDVFVEIGMFSLK